MLSKKTQTTNYDLVSVLLSREYSFSIMTKIRILKTKIADYLYCNQKYSYYK